MNEVHASLACNLDSDLLLASLPLFESEKVAAMEWSFDTLFRHRNIPPWFLELLTTYGEAGRLVGHGVFFSIFSGKWSEPQTAWLEELRRKSEYFNFDHVTEHFGFMTGEDFHKGAPLSVPMTAATLAIGRDRLFRIQDACACPVGLENLAFAYSLDEVKQHGEFLNKLLEPVNGFIILDLHNLYCQLHNFSVSFKEIIQLFPLERVREIHISGGSWDEASKAPEGKIRRDTHDDSVPEMVFELLEKTIPLCPDLKYVVLEQLGQALGEESQRTQFQNDFFRMEKIVKTTPKGYGKCNQDFLPKIENENEEIVESPFLARQQSELSHILENADDLSEAQSLLAKSLLANSDWQVENWNPLMLETAVKIAQKWKKGW